METSALQPIRDNNVAVFHTRSSAASVSSSENTVRANNRDLTLEQINQSCNALDDIQQGSFNAVWASIDQGQQQYLRFCLQSLVFTQNIKDEKAKEKAKAEVFSLMDHMDYLLRYEETTEHASNVTQVTEFLILLRSLSDDAMKEMLAMTQPRPPDFAVAEDNNRRDGEDTITRSTARGTIGSTGTTAGLTARSMICTLTPEAGSAPVGADRGKAALKGCCAIFNGDVWYDADPTRNEAAQKEAKNAIEGKTTLRQRDWIEENGLENLNLTRGPCEPAATDKMPSSVKKLRARPMEGFALQKREYSEAFDHFVGPR